VPGWISYLLSLGLQLVLYSDFLSTHADATRHGRINKRQIDTGYSGEFGLVAFRQLIGVLSRGPRRTRFTKQKQKSSEHPFPTKV